MSTVYWARAENRQTRVYAIATVINSHPFVPSNSLSWHLHDTAFYRCLCLAVSSRYLLDKPLQLVYCLHWLSKHESEFKY